MPYKHLGNLLTGLVLLLAAKAWAAAPTVAHVSLAVGEAARISATGKREPLKTGDSLQEQDRVITGADALLLIVFTDQGRLALRPDTELIIRNYRIDPSGADTRMRFELVRGTVRQISGQGAHLQPERYRLNTPVAAIGVRGTDFLAKANAQSVETYVHEGMIVLMPPANECAGSSHCAIWAALSSGDAGQYLQVQTGGRIQRANVNPDDIERIFGLRIAAAPAASSGPTRTAGGTSTGTFVASAASDVSKPDGADLLHPRADNINLEALALRPAQPAPQQPAPPPAVSNDPIPLPTQLVWGRFSNPLQLPFTLPQSFADASDGRKVTVGEIGQYALWRNTPAGAPDEVSLRGQASFDLAASEAYYQQGSSIQALTVSNARLTADFDQSRFSTQLQLNGSNVPSATISASGRINEQGMFVSATSQHRVAGAFSRDGKEAGYFFNNTAAQGSYQGITLWSASKK